MLKKNRSFFWGLKLGWPPAGNLNGKVGRHSGGFSSRSCTLQTSHGSGRTKLHQWWWAQFYSEGGEKTSDDFSPSQHLAKINLTSFLVKGAGWGGEGRQGGGRESQILEDPAQFLTLVVVSSQSIWKLRRFSQPSTFTFTTFTFCNCLMKNDLCHSLIVYHLKRMRLHWKLVKYMFRNLSIWGSFVQCNRKRYQ